MTLWKRFCSLLTTPSPNEQNVRKGKMFKQLRTGAESCPTRRNRAIKQLVQLMNLEYLEVGATDISDEALNKLRQALPDLKVNRTVRCKEAAAL